MTSPGGNTQGICRPKRAAARARSSPRATGHRVFQNAHQPPITSPAAGSDAQNNSQGPTSAKPLSTRNGYGVARARPTPGRSVDGAHASHMNRNIKTVVVSEVNGNKVSSIHAVPGVSAAVN